MGGPHLWVRSLLPQTPVTIAVVTYDTKITGAVPCFTQLTGD